LETFPRRPASFEDKALVKRGASLGKKTVRLRTKSGENKASLKLESKKQPERGLARDRKEERRDEGKVRC